MEVLPFAPRESSARQALDAGRLRLVHLGAGENENVVCGGIIRGERDYYAVVARAGQTLELCLEAAEANAVLDVYTPGARISWYRDQLEVSGPKLEGGPCDHRWEGRVPLTGPYLVEVGPTRGNATYRLTVALREPNERRGRPSDH